MTVAATLSFIILCGLGTWQVHRLSWKEDLIATRVARIDGPEIVFSLGSDGRPILPPIHEIEYRPWRISGHFDPATNVLLSATRIDGRTGSYRVSFLTITAPEEFSGRRIAVDRGFVPLQRDPETGAQTDSTQDGGIVEASPEVSVSGWIRGDWRPGWLTPANRLDDGYLISMDIAAYAAHVGVNDPLPFYLQAGPNGDGSVDGPRGRKPEIALPNRHMEYAGTWYALAIVLAGVFAAYHWRR